MTNQVKPKRLRHNWLAMVAGASFVLAIATGCNNAANGNNGQAAILSPKSANTSTAQKAVPASLDSKATIATYTGGSVTKGEFDTEYNVISFLGPVTSPGSTLPTKSQFIQNYAMYFGYLADLANKDASLKKTATAQLNKDYPQFMSQLTTQFTNAATLTKKLQAAGITRVDLKNYLYMDLLLNTYMQKAIGPSKVTNAEVASFISKNKAHYTEVHAAHILVKTLKTAKMIEQKLKAGGNFAKLAKQYSLDGSKSKGGDLGTTTADQYVTPFANACMTLPIGQISAPVHSQFGYHIIKVLSRTTLTSQAKQDLISQKQSEASQAILTKVQNKAHVKVTAAAGQL